MSIMNTLNTAVDSNTADSIVDVYRASVKRILVAPYKSMMFAITSCLLIGGKYVLFIWISAALCLGFSGISLVLFLSSGDWKFLGYIAGGLLAILFILLVLRKDSGHTQILKESQEFGVQQIQQIQQVPQGFQQSGFRQSGFQHQGCQQGFQQSGFQHQGCQQGFQQSGFQQDCCQQDSKQQVSGDVDLDEMDLDELDLDELD